MSFIAKFVVYVVAAIVVIFAVVNRAPVTLSLWPLPIEVTVPLFAALLAAVAVGVVLGGAAARIGAVRRERRARKTNPPRPAIDPIVLAQPPRPPVAYPPPPALPARSRTERAMVDD